MNRNGILLFACGLAAAFNVAWAATPGCTVNPGGDTPLDTRPTRGGPADGFSWISSLDPEGPEPGFVDMTGISIDLELSAQNQLIPMGLPIIFPFYGQPLEYILVSANGWVSFDMATLGHFPNEAIPTPGSVDNAVFAFWDGLVPGPDSRVLAASEPTTGAVVFHWEHMLLEGVAGYCTFQLILQTDGSIVLNYLDMFDGEPQGVEGATVGVEGPGGTQGLAVNVNGQGAQLTSGVTFVLTPASGRPMPVTDLRIERVVQPWYTLPNFRYDWTPVTLDTTGHPVIVDHYDVYITLGSPLAPFPGDWILLESVAAPPSTLYGYFQPFVAARVVAVGVPQAGPLQPGPMTP